ncbi:hypothetical protein LTR62_004637 [Meristemomyces frigidus]|uniref:Uncharacterized protein n=1 Tax=Meristemomyces frigidus TaxID=1508187 RepID=A0AAN7TDQ2_9PEZI|nr:hypothetical protein LTR62_004637 [Meristemomyces frigidus]
MAAPRQGWNEEVALSCRTGRTQVIEDRATIARSLGLFLDQLEADELEDEEPFLGGSFKLAASNRRVVLQNGHQVSETAIMDLNALFAAEQKAVAEAQASVLSLQLGHEERLAIFEAATGVDLSNTKEARTYAGDWNFLLRATEQHIHQKVEGLAFARSGTQISLAAPQAHAIPRYAEVLLSDFFEVCHDPNEAEIAMLVRACRLPRFRIVDRWYDTLVPDSTEKMPEVRRLFVPDYGTFHDVLTGTTMSVEDLVLHCQRAGYLGNSNASTNAANVQGVLSLAVQLAPTTAGMTTLPAITESVEVASAAGSSLMPLGPFSLNLHDQLEMALAKKQPEGNATLVAATKAVTAAGVYPYNNLFDPTSQFEVSFNPAAEDTTLADGGIWSSYYPAANFILEDVTTFEWTDFVQDRELV